MPYTRDWDEASPPGSAPANTLDTIIQHLKTDMRERLAQVVRGWSDDDIDPKGIKFQTGSADSRPSDDLEPGFAYFASDTGDLTIWNGTAWVAMEGGGGGTSVGGHRGFDYDADAVSSGARLGTTQVVGEVISLNLQGDTSVNGTIVIDLHDFNAGYNSTHVISAVATIYGVTGRFVTNDSLRSDAPNDSWAFRVFLHDGTIVVSTSVFMNVILVMEALEE